VKRICNLEQGKGFMCKIGGLRAYLQIDFKNQGIECKICIKVWSAV
jgi:hypothetical protein